MPCAACKREAGGQADGACGLVPLRCSWASSRAPTSRSGQRRLPGLHGRTRMQFGMQNTGRRAWERASSRHAQAACRGRPLAGKAAGTGSSVLPAGDGSRTRALPSVGWPVPLCWLSRELTWHLFYHPEQPLGQLVAWPKPLQVYHLGRGGRGERGELDRWAGGQVSLGSAPAVQAPVGRCAVDCASPA